MNTNPGNVVSSIINKQNKLFKEFAYPTIWLPRKCEEQVWQTRHCHEAASVGCEAGGDQHRKHKKVCRKFREVCPPKASKRLSDWKPRLTAFEVDFRYTTWRLMGLSNHLWFCGCSYNLNYNLPNSCCTGCPNGKLGS